MLSVRIRKKVHKKYAGEGKFVCELYLLYVSEAAILLYQTTKHGLICVKQKLTLSPDEILTPRLHRSADQ